MMKEGVVKLADFGVAIKGGWVLGDGLSGVFGVEGRLEGSDGDVSDGCGIGDGMWVEGEGEGDKALGISYWMASEVIEMWSVMVVVDIWSVGCIIIELLISNLLYFDFDFMLVLFRIVRDEYSSLSTGILEALRDFLLLCFKRDLKDWLSVEELINYMWLMDEYKVFVEMWIKWDVSGGWM